MPAAERLRRRRVRAAFPLALALQVDLVALVDRRLPRAIIGHRGQQVALADHADGAAHGVGATGEAEQEDIVARLVILRDELVRLPHVVGEPDPECPSEHAVDEITGAHALIVVNALHDAVAVLRQHPAREFHHVGRAYHAAVRLVRRIPRAVAADDEAFHPGSLGVG